MSVPFLIIDGYNLLHAVGLAREKYGPGDLARQRHKLLVTLARRLTIDERRRCTVVFDAIDAPPNLSRTFRHEEMAVLFAEPGHEADEVIELLISQHSAPRRLTVISSDHRLQTAIRKRRGKSMDSDVFIAQIESPDRSIAPPQASKLPQPSKSREIMPNAEVEFWVQEFSDISPEKLSEELLEQSGGTKSDWDEQIDKLQNRLRNSEDLDDWLNEPPSQSVPPKSKSKKSDRKK